MQVKEFAVGDYFTRISRRGEPFDLAVSGYTAGPRIGSEPQHLRQQQYRPGELQQLRRPGLRPKAPCGGKLSGASRNRAASRLALELERDDAPAAAIGTDASRDFFSARMGCQVYQPGFGIDLGALCLRE